MSSPSSSVFFLFSRLDNILLHPPASLSPLSLSRIRLLVNIHGRSVDVDSAYASGEDRTYNVRACTRSDATAMAAFECAHILLVVLSAHEQRCVERVFHPIRLKYAESK